MRNRNDYRVALLSKKVRNWRIVAGLLVLIALYGFMGRMDREAHIERMHLDAPENSKLSGGVRV